MSTETKDPIYTETMGTTTYATGRIGTTTATRRVDGRLAGVFVKEDEGGMFYVSVGEPSGERGAWHEVAAVEPITRFRFDKLVALDVVRHSMGWRA